MVFNTIKLLILIVIILYLSSCGKMNDIEPEKKQFEKSNSINDWFTLGDTNITDTILLFQRDNHFVESFTVKRRVIKNCVVIKNTTDSLIYSDRVELEYESKLYNIYIKISVELDSCYGHNLYVKHYTLNNGFYNLVGNIGTCNNEYNKLEYRKFISFNGYNFYNVYLIGVLDGLYPIEVKKLYINKEKGLVGFFMSNMRIWHLL